MIPIRIEIEGLAHHDRFCRIPGTLRSTVEEFFDPSQPRDKDGKWTRTGRSFGGISAHPTQRTQPASKVTSDDFTDKDAALGLVKRIWGGPGVRDIEITGRGRDDDRNEYDISVSGVLVNKSGDEVGHFERRIELRRGTLIVHHESLVIDPVYQGRGYGTDWNKRAVEQYRELGADRIQITAAAVGGYAWAREGFRASTPGELKHVFRQAKNNVAGIPAEHRDVVRSQIEKLETAIADGKDILPIHIASLGEDTMRFTAETREGGRYESWPGKEMLLGTYWEGVYYLDVDSVTASVERVEEFYNPSQPRDRRGRWSRVSVSPVDVRPGVTTSAGRDSVARALRIAAIKCKPPPCTEESIEKIERDARRKRLHDQIVSEALEGATPPPTLMILGGGGGSGKSTVLKKLDLGSGKAVVNADDVKEKIPEYRDLVDLRDPSAAAYVHEESSLISKDIQAEARARGVGVVLDQVASNPDKVLRQISDFVDAGYSDIRASFVTVPTDVAIERARSRGERTGRIVPDTVLRAAHRDVSRGFETIARDSRIQEVTLFDNSGSEPVLIARGGRGNLEILDQVRYDQFIAKGAA